MPAHTVTSAAAHTAADLHAYVSDPVTWAVWFALFLVAAAVANGRQMSAVARFLVSVILLLVLRRLSTLISPANKDACNRMSQFRRLTQCYLDSRRSKHCPRCAECIQAEAQICRFCGSSTEPWPFY